MQSIMYYWYKLKRAGFSGTPTREEDWTVNLGMLHDLSQSTQNACESYDLKHENVTWYGKFSSILRVIWKHVLVCTFVSRWVKRSLSRGHDLSDHWKPKPMSVGSIYVPTYIHTSTRDYITKRSSTSRLFMIFIIAWICATVSTYTVIAYWPSRDMHFARSGLPEILCPVHQLRGNLLIMHYDGSK